MQVQYTAYGEVYFDSNPDFVLVIGFHGGLYDPLTRLLHFGDRDYDIPAGRYSLILQSQSWDAIVLSLSHMLYVFYKGGQLLTSAHGHVLVKTPSPSTCTCSEATTPSARFSRSKNMSQVKKMPDEPLSESRPFGIPMGTGCILRRVICGGCVKQKRQ